MAKKQISARKDYDRNQLPKNRKEQFFDILVRRYGLFIKLGIFILLFFIPYFFVMMYKDSLYMSIKAGNYEDAGARIFSVDLIYSGLMFIALPILFVGFAGVFKILKELIYGEPIFFKEDFIEGIKENSKSFIVIAAIIALFNLFELLISYSFSNNVVFEVIPVAFNYVLIFPICFVSIYLTSVYTNKFMVTLKTSIIILFKFLPRILLCFIFTFGFFALEFIPIAYIKYCVVIVCLVFVLPISIFASYENFIDIFDENINKTQFPNFYKKGIEYNK